MKSVNPISTRAGGHIIPTQYYVPPPQIFRPYDGPERKLYWYQFFQKTNKNNFLDEMRTNCLNTWLSQFGDRKISGRSKVRFPFLIPGGLRND